MIQSTSPLSSEVILPPRKRMREDDELHQVGYKVYRAAFEVDATLLGCAQTACKGRAGIIFNHNEHQARSDRRRRQARIPKNRKRMQRLMADGERFVRQRFSRAHQARDWVVLHSRPGCQDQAAHSDYVPDAAMQQASDAEMPLAMVIALMPGTKLNVWPSAVRLGERSSEELRAMAPIRCEVAHLDAGDALVFRGDFVHAGAAYEEENFRIHTFLDHPAVPRNPNETWLVHQQDEEELRRIIVPK